MPAGPYSSSRVSINSRRSRVPRCSDWRLMDLNYGAVLVSDLRTECRTTTLKVAPSAHQGLPRFLHPLFELGEVTVVLDHHVRCSLGRAEITRGDTRFCIRCP